MKNGKKLIVLALSMIVIATTAVSLAYWNSGINGNNRDDYLNVNIGTGGTAQTVVNLSQAGGTTDKLIPQNIAATTGETNIITFTVTATWTGAAAGEGESNDVAGAAGILTATLEGIKIGGEDLTGADLALFVVTFDEDDYNIIGEGSGVPVTVTVKMNEPADKTQYDFVANKAITITINFAVRPVV